MKRTRHILISAVLVLYSIYGTCQSDSALTKKIQSASEIANQADSLRRNTPNIITRTKDSVPPKKNFTKKQKVHVGGNIANQFDYGAIPYYMASPQFPANLYKSSGNFNLRFGKLPLLADYFYSNPRSISGLNNYFTVRLDVNELQRMQNNSYLQKALSLKKQVDSLSVQNQLLKQQLALLETQKIQKIIPPLPKDSIPNISPPRLPGDSLKLNDSLKANIKNPVDSLRNIYSKLDTSTARINGIKNQIEKNERLIETLKQKVAAVENPNSALDPSAAYPRTNFEKAMGGFKRLEVGMCYPSYSTFMINQMAIKGINTGYEFKDFFVNASAGKTVVNYSVLTTANPILNQIQNLNSFFDWNKNQNEKKITAMKLGYGKENKSYVGIGALYGRGTTSPLSTDIKNNFVFEIDGRYMYKFITAEASISKSFLTDKSSSPINSELAGNQQKTNWDKSYQGKISGTVPKIKTKFSVLYRQVEPFFKSFGVGFMRSDILRYETKLEQPIGNKFKVGFNYRRDEDNLKQLLSYKTILENFSYSAKIKLIKKRLDLTLNYADIHQSINNIPVSETKKIRSNIKTGILTYTPRLKKLQTTNTLICNLYELNDGVQATHLENYSLSSFNQYRKWQLNSMNSFNQNSIQDSLNFTNAINNTLELGYQFSEKLSVKGGAKYAYSVKTKTSQYGYSAGIAMKLHKLFNLEVRAEKLVIGDFINMLNYSAISQFPYYGYVKLTSNF